MDVNVWEEIHKKLTEGLPVYADQDFHVDVLEAMNLEIEELTKRVAVAETAAALAVERKERLERDIEKLSPVLTALGVNLLPSRRRG